MKLSLLHRAHRSKFVRRLIHSIRLAITTRPGIGFIHEFLRFTTIWIVLPLSVLYATAVQGNAQLAGPRTLPGNLREFVRVDYSITEAREDTVHVSPTTITLDFILHAEGGRTARGRLRIPSVGSPPYPLAFLTVGLETGKNVVGMIEGHDSIIVAAIDYPFDPSLDFSGLGGFLKLFQAYGDAAESISSTLLCLQWLLDKPIVDTADVSMISVSFGVFTAVPVAVIEQRFSKLVVIEGGGNLGLIIKTNAKKSGTFVPSWLAGWFGGFVLSRYDPKHYIDNFAPRPVLIVGSAADDFFPAESVQALYDSAKEPKEIIWHERAHVMPYQQDRIRELTRLVAQRLYGGISG